MHHKLRSKKIQDRYHIHHHERRFDIAQERCARAQNIVAAKEPRWSSLVKEMLFGELIEHARLAENVEYGGQLRVQKIIQRLRVYAAFN